MRRLFKEMMIIFLAVVAGIYLLNPFGGLDFLPDFLPLVGNLDEAGAVLVLVNTLRYYGLDVARLYMRRETQRSLPPTHDPRR
ncbi:MAG: DUF1232 domain-containing protein [Chloroflexi bacterium]|nr:DUF1232 domain-containing protein [Chloroflexota bacterium]